MQGSGWGIFSWEPLGRRLIIEQLEDHHENTTLGAVPLLAIDAWEHAYYLQYQNRKRRLRRGHLERRQLGRRCPEIRSRNGLATRP